MLEMARMVCSCIVEYTEQAGVVVWRKMIVRLLLHMQNVQLIIVKYIEKKTAV